jgi:23S rRNA-/tRNA-specific pseudouridylate synthase
MVFINNSYDPYGHLPEQVKLMNDTVVKTAVGQIGTGISQYIGYLKEISTPLDDKEALTQFWVREVQLGHSLLEIELKTGRLHQIRRHLSSIKLPILGDPLYGKNNKNQTGMKLLAYSVSFKDPWSQKNQEFKLPEALKLSSL